MKMLPAFNYILPVWSYDELLSANPNKESWYQIYEKCGGVARSILADQSSLTLIVESLESKLVDIRSNLIENYKKRFSVPSISILAMQWFISIHVVLMMVIIYI